MTGYGAGGYGAGGYGVGESATPPVDPGGPPSALALMVLDRVLDRGPGLVDVTVSDAEPNSTVTFYIDDMVAFSEVTDDVGELYALSIPFGSLAAGIHTVYAVTSTSTGAATFTLTDEPYEQVTDVGDDADPTPRPAPTSVRRWVLEDQAPGGLGIWEMPANPISSSGPLVSRNLVPKRTTYVGGRHHITGGAPTLTSLGLVGYVASKADHDKLVSFGELNRRFWLTDHRGRAFKVVFDAVELTPRLRQAGESGTFNDWAHDYQITAQLFSENWRDV